MKKIETNSNQFQNVLKKAIEKKPLVKCLPFHPGNSTIAYLVRGSSGDFYPVRFQRAGGGAMLGSCLCAGSVRGFHCYHLAAALLAHSSFVRSGLRPPAPSREMAASRQSASRLRASLSHLDFRGSESVRNLI